MHSSLCLPLQAASSSQGGAATTVSRSSPRSACIWQPWRSQVRIPLRLRLNRHRGAPGLVLVCETAVEVDGSATTEEVGTPPPAVGSRIRVCKPLRVFHVPKNPSFELEGREGELKEVLKVWKGKPLSANLPFKVQFILDLDGKQVKFFAHLKQDEFQVI